MTPNTRYVTEDGYKYTTDEIGRIVDVDADNLVAQNSQLNRAGGEWYNMETEWANALKEVPPKKVSVSIKPMYSNNSMRPNSFIVEYEIEGQFSVLREIANQSGG
ncbi:DNA/RNA non-specific endonuclease [Oceanobacillus timonensis]|uniref:DNA/RNA non-specific endonuclease n=1 Tax=Oceanobacillus timonensis TaxID=1926285 RepID=UPI001FE4F535|nr:DNA/RNA non-specific endonuclease [Oceanobacillus timonensis]